MRTLLTLGAGALAMYLFDPDHGRRRRALLRDQLMRAQDAMRERAELGGRPISTQLEADKPTDTPEGAHHLGR